MDLKSKAEKSICHYEERLREINSIDTSELSFKEIGGLCNELELEINTLNSEQASILPEAARASIQHQYLKILQQYMDIVNEVSSTRELIIKLAITNATTYNRAEATFERQVSKAREKLEELSSNPTIGLYFKQFLILYIETELQRLDEEFLNQLLLYVPQEMCASIKDLYFTNVVQWRAIVKYYELLTELATLKAPIYKSEATFERQFTTAKQALKELKSNEAIDAHFKQDLNLRYERELQRLDEEVFNQFILYLPQKIRTSLKDLYLTNVEQCKAIVKYYELLTDLATLEAPMHKREKATFERQIIAAKQELKKLKSDEAIDAHFKQDLNLRYEREFQRLDKEVLIQWLLYVPQEMRASIKDLYLTNVEQCKAIVKHYELLTELATLKAPMYKSQEATFERQITTAKQELKELKSNEAIDTHFKQDLNLRYEREFQRLDKEFLDQFILYVPQEMCSSIKDLYSTNVEQCRAIVKHYELLTDLATLKAPMHKRGNTTFEIQITTAKQELKKLMSNETIDAHFKQDLNLRYERELQRLDEEVLKQLLLYLPQEIRPSIKDLYTTNVEHCRTIVKYYELLTDLATLKAPMHKRGKTTFEIQITTAKQELKKLMSNETIDAHFKQDLNLRYKREVQRLDEEVLKQLLLYLPQEMRASLKDLYLTNVEQCRVIVKYYELLTELATLKAPMHKGEEATFEIQITTAKQELGKLMSNETIDAHFKQDLNLRYERELQRLDEEVLYQFILDLPQEILPSIKDLYFTNVEQCRAIVKYYELLTKLATLKAPTHKSQEATFDRQIITAKQELGKLKSNETIDAHFKQDLNLRYERELQRLDEEVLKQLLLYVPQEMRASIKDLYLTNVEQCRVIVKHYKLLTKLATLKAPSYKWEEATFDRQITTAKQELGKLMSNETIDAHFKQDLNLRYKRELQRLDEEVLDQLLLHVPQEMRASIKDLYLTNVEQCRVIVKYYELLTELATLKAPSYKWEEATFDRQITTAKQELGKLMSNETIDAHFKQDLNLRYKRELQRLDEEVLDQLLLHVPQEMRASIKDLYLTNVEQCRVIVKYYELLTELATLKAPSYKREEATFERQITTAKQELKKLKSNETIYTHFKQDLNLRYERELQRLDEEVLDQFLYFRDSFEPHSYSLQYLIMWRNAVQEKLDKIKTFSQRIPQQIMQEKKQKYESLMKELRAEILKLRTYPILEPWCSYCMRKGLSHLMQGEFIFLVYPGIEEDMRSLKLSDRDILPGGITRQEYGTRMNRLSMESAIAIEELEDRNAIDLGRKLKWIEGPFAEIELRINFAFQELPLLYRDGRTLEYLVDNHQDDELLKKIYDVVLRNISQFYGNKIDVPSVVINSENEPIHVSPPKEESNISTASGYS